MVHIITKGCIECGRCIRECPDKAIYKGNRASVIDPRKCTDCASCVEVCPLELIIPEFEYDPELE